MPPDVIYQFIGYAASLLVAVSLMMSSILKLRIINLVGAVVFTVYGLLIHAYPVAAVNFLITLIDLYYLYQMLITKEFFRLLNVSPDSEYLRYFISFHDQDIRRFQPGFAFEASDNLLIFFILRNLVPAGLVIGEIRDTDSLYIRLDYAIPGYRDLKIGRFLFQQHAQDFRARGIHKIFSKPGAPAHARYLKQMGFEPVPSPTGDPLYCLAV